MKPIVIAVAALVFAAPAHAATVVGSGETAWGEHFTMSVSERKFPDEHGRLRTLDCLDLRDDSGGGSGCPLTAPKEHFFDVQSDYSCGRRGTTAIYGALDPRVAAVQVRLGGGRILHAQRFDPDPAVDPDIAYWIATTRGLPIIRSITAVGADGAVLRRDRDVQGGRAACEPDHPFRGRRLLLGSGTLPNGHDWQMNAYRRTVTEDQKRQKRLCIGLEIENSVISRFRPFDPTSESCGFRLDKRVRAMALGGSTDG